MDSSVCTSRTLGSPGCSMEKPVGSPGASGNPTKFNKCKILNLAQGTHQYNDDGIESSPEEKSWEIPVDGKLDMSW